MVFGGLVIFCRPWCFRFCDQIFVLRLPFCCFDGTVLFMLCIFHLCGVFEVLFFWHVDGGCAVLIWLRAGEKKVLWIEVNV